MKANTKGAAQITPEEMAEARREVLLSRVPSNIRAAARDMNNEELEDFVYMITQPAIHNEGFASGDEIRDGLLEAVRKNRHNPSAGRDWLLEMKRKGRL